MPNKISKATRIHLLSVMRELAHNARIDEYVVQHMLKANPKIWIQKARQHVAAQKAHRHDVRRWPIGYPKQSLPMGGGFRRGEFTVFSGHPTS
jgi:hypothetical protein